ncbi:MAG TPA: hypothetical protein VHG08_28115 [Longimicrobium sp.]|nr:hypothetical protein [Longimicrobium sp.]
MRPLRLLPACALLITMAGCIGWKRVPPPITAPDGGPARFGIARITLANGAVEELSDVRVTADSVTGTRITDDGRGVRVSLPRAQVVVVEREGVNVRATALASALAAAAAGAVWLYALFMSSM